MSGRNDGRGGVFFLACSAWRRWGGGAIGPAYVALMSQDDNLSVREAIQAPYTPGCVLIVAGGNTSRTATIGGLLALEMQNRGIIALVTDGLVRDARDIRQMQQFNVWCRGVTPAASQKQGPAAIGGSCCRGGRLRRGGHPGCRAGGWRVCCAQGPTGD